MNLLNVFPSSMLEKCKRQVINPMAGKIKIIRLNVQRFIYVVIQLDMLENHNVVNIAFHQVQYCKNLHLK